jgi:predicted lipid-binding transport protein (Tim44 family)
METILQLGMMALGTLVSGFVMFIALFPENALVVNFKKSVFGAEDPAAAAAAAAGNSGSSKQTPSSSASSGAKHASSASKTESVSIFATTRHIHLTLHSIL